MSKEGSPELTKSWIFVNPSPDEDIQQTKDTSGIEEVTENEPHDSDTDSISVISEGGCSYKTDEEEFAPVEMNEEKVSKETEFTEKEPETVSVQSEIVYGPEVVTVDENKAIETLLYFGTSAVCAIILVGFSIAVQKYVHDASHLSKLEPDQHVIPHVQTLRSGNMLKESHPNKFQMKRKNLLKSVEFEHKVAKLQDEECNDKIASSDRDNDPKVEGNFKSNYKLSKNKCNEENCDISEKPATDDDEVIPSEKFNQNAKEDESHDAAYDKKVEKLKIKENYLREKEKFLIEKEHDLMKKEIKLNKEKQQYTKNKHDKSSLNKGKKFSGESSEESDSSEKKDKIKYKRHPNSKKNNKKTSQEDKKQEPQQKRLKFAEEQAKKRNVSGQWYLNLHEARDSMRQKKRSHFKKNKAHWYFQWMVDRARLRVK